MTITEKDNKIIYRLKLDNGQVVEMTIDQEVYTDTIFYYVCLFINKRGKGYKSGKQTGTAGIEGLLWAKEMLRDFIDTLKDFPNRKHTISIFLDDNRRRDVYIRGLRDLGFKVNTLIRWKCLQLTIPKIK